MMGKHLDLDDLAADHPAALEELAGLRLARDRWETARRMNPTQWGDAKRLNADTGKPFDEIVDEMRSYFFGEF